MKWLRGVFTKRFNIRHKLCGPLFAGRHRALVVEGTWTYVSNVLNERPQTAPQGQEVLALCQ